MRYLSLIRCARTVSVHHPTGLRLVISCCLFGRRDARLGTARSNRSYLGEVVDSASDQFAGEANDSLSRLREGSRIAGYVLEQRVGKGGMGVVFRARHELLGRMVALKILAPDLASDEAFRRRFILESRAADAVSNPHIIPVYDAGEEDGAMFIAMQYVSGGDAHTLVRRNGPLPPDRAAGMVSAVASALDAAHAVGLVHRDIKPANILVDIQPGQPDHVYVSDFGLSKDTTFSHGLTASGQFMGTPDFSAPEQMRGDRVDGRADQYSLACAAYVLLTGAPPYPRDDVTAVIWAHMTETPPTITSRCPHLPTAVDEVLARALAKDPRQRYPACRKFADALQQALKAEPGRPGIAPKQTTAPESAPEPGAPGRSGTQLMSRQPSAYLLGDGEMVSPYATWRRARNRTGWTVTRATLALLAGAVAVAAALVPLLILHPLQGPAIPAAFDGTWTGSVQNAPNDQVTVIFTGGTS
ncbi:MAG: serine/threonine protein kinase, partial [Actinobacteria bacterium]|nr:serine/threonine protein kinase [Actinomycetota bacterium]